MMKKFLPTLILTIFLTVLLAPMVASAQTQPVDSCTVSAVTGGRINVYLPSCPAAGGTYNETTAGKTWGMCCVFNALFTATDWIFVILMVIVTLLVIWGALQIVTAGGAPEKVTTGRNFILYAMIGLAVALFAKAIPSIVKALLGA